MPVFMRNSAPEIRAKFDAPDFVENNEEMLRQEFSNYFQVTPCLVSSLLFVDVDIKEEYCTGEHIYLPAT